MPPLSTPDKLQRTSQGPGTGYLFARVFLNEGRILLADRTLWLTCGLLFLFIGYSLYVGLSQVRAREAVLQEITMRDAEKADKNVTQLRRILAGHETPDPFSNPADPASVASGLGARHAVLPYLALAPLALGQSDMAPNYYRVTNRNKSTFLYDGEMDNPWNLMTGHFDTAFVVIYLLPLLILGVSYNMLSAERERGTLRLLLSHSLGIGTLLLAKTAVRALAILATTGVTVGAVLLPARGSGPEYLFWLGMVAAYAVFWFAVAAAVNALGKASATNAFALIVVWVTLVILAPVLLNLAVSQAYPAPSRTELATRIRLITIGGLNRFADLLATDYRHVGKSQVLLPKDGKIEVAERRKAHLLIAREVDAELDTLLAAFEKQMLTQQQFIERFSLISPAAVIHEGMSALAGTGSRRYTQFTQQVSAYHMDWKAFFEARILNGVAMTEPDFARLPRFSWLEQPATALRGQLAGYALQLLFPSLLLGLWARRRLRHYPTV